MKTGPLTPAQLEQLRGLSTCLVSSAIATMGVRMANTGFADSRVRCVFEDLPPIVGYAATARIRTSQPPMQGGQYSYERSDWWNYILSVPAPRVVAIEDVEHPPGLGAFAGEVYASILLALGCTALVTNGGVRDLNEVRPTGLQMFAGNVCVSHAYAHIFDFGGPVEVGGLRIRPGDLVHGDRNGVQTIPGEIAELIPDAASEILNRRRRLIGICRSKQFSIQALREAIQAPELKS